MKKRRLVISVIALLSCIFVIILLFSSCSFFESKLNYIKGRLIGVEYNIEEYDNYGRLSMTAHGKSIDINCNKVAEKGFDSSGNVITNYTLSSVLNITVDGHEWNPCGSSIIFAENGLKKDVDFQQKNIEGNNNDLTSLPPVSKFVNQYRNYFGKPRVVVIKSQLGFPICAYSGDKVYFELPEDLPKMTKLVIDGRVLYIHRVNFDIIDLNLLK